MLTCHQMILALLMFVSHLEISGKGNLSWNSLLYSEYLQLFSGKHIRHSAMYRYRGTGDTPLDLSSLLNKFSNETIFGNHRNAVVVAVNNRARLHCEVINFGGGGIGKQSVNPWPH